MNLSLHSVILFVRNVEVLKHFYQKNFQLELSEEIKDEWVVLRAGHCDLALHKMGSFFEENTGTVYPVNNNVKLVFETAANLSQLREDLIRSHVVMREIKSFDNFKHVCCDGIDPEGNVFQLMQRVG